MFFLHNLGNQTDEISQKFLELVKSQQMHPQTQPATREFCLTQYY